MHPLDLFKYCPKCGSIHFVINNEKSKRCETCGFVYYFNPSAATYALILNDDQELLVCSRKKDPAKGTWDLPGGFLDMDEDGEEGIKREVKEETGLEITEAKYLFSVPNIYMYSGFNVHTLDLAFECKVKSPYILEANDDVEECFFIALDKIDPDKFGLDSVRKGFLKYLKLKRNEE